MPIIVTIITSILIFKWLEVAAEEYDEKIEREKIKPVNIRDEYNKKKLKQLEKFKLEKIRLENMVITKTKWTPEMESIYNSFKTTLNYKKEIKKC